jgi:uncharacterized RDD family membrane protein YckC
MNALAQKSILSGSRLDNRRMLAALIDLALVGAGGAAILVAGGDGLSLGGPLAGVVLCWALYYYFACESGGGQTLGKRLMKLRVVREDGSAAGMREIAVRTVLRVVDTALVGLLAMLATGERRARLGDLAAGTMIVSIEAAAPAVPPAATVEEEPEAFEESDAGFDEDNYEETDSFGEEAAAAGPAAPYEPITRFDPMDDEPDIASPSLKELAQDIAATAGGAPEHVAPAEEPEPVVEVRPVDAEPVAPVEPVVEIRPVEEAEPVVEREPLVEVDVGGPEIDVDGPDLTVRSVETVSAIDLVMGADEPSDDRPAADEPPAGA